LYDNRSLENKTFLKNIINKTIKQRGGRAKCFPKLVYNNKGISYINTRDYKDMFDFLGILS